MAISSAIIGAASALYDYAQPYIQNSMQMHNAKAMADLQNQYQLGLMDHQYNLQQRSLVESPSNYRAGLVKAGYNPILPFSGSGGSGFNAGSVSGGSAGMPTLPQMNSSDKSESIQKLLTFGAQLDNLKSNTDLNNANSALTQEKTRTEVIDQGLKTVEKEIADIDKRMKDFDLSKQDERWNLEQKERLNNIKAIYMNAMSNQAQAAAAGVSAKANMLNAEGSHYYNTHRALGFSESRTNTESKTGGSNASTNVGLKGMGMSRGSNKSHTRSRSFSRTW